MTKPNECTTKHEKELAMNVTMPEETENNIEKLILFLYTALGRPNKSTLIKAIQNGHLATGPGMTVKRVNKCIKGDIINVKEYKHLQRQVKRKGKGQKKKCEISELQQEINNEKQMNTMPK